MELDKRLHTPLCTKKYVDTSFGRQDDSIQYKNKESLLEKDSQELSDIKNEEDKIDMDEDSQNEEESTKSSPKKEFKKEFKKEVDILSERSEEETENITKNEKPVNVKLRNLEEDLLIDDNRSDKSKDLNELLSLESDSVGSNMSDQKEVDDTKEDFYANNDDIKALLMDEKSLDEDMSDMSDSDAENKKDPCFKQLINIDCISADSQDIEDYETLNILTKDIDQLSLDSSDAEDELLKDYDEDLDDEEEETIKGKKVIKTKNKNKRMSKEKRGPRFIPLSEADQLKLKRKKKKKQKEIDEKQKQIEIANLQISGSGFSNKALENEAFIKFIKEVFHNPDDSEYTKESGKLRKDENENYIRKLRDMDRFEDIITHLGQLTPSIFTGEYKKVKACSLCKFKDFQSELGFYMSGFPMSLSNEAAQLRVLYIKLDESSNRKFSLIGDIELDEYQKYDIPLLPQTYSICDIKNTIISTQKDFDGSAKELVLADLSMNVDLTQLLTNDDITFELKEGDKNGIFAYEVEKKHKNVAIKDFIHIMSYDECLKTYPRFVGIDLRQK